jgi:hypothetical protein
MAGIAAMLAAMAYLAWMLLKRWRGSVKVALENPELVAVFDEETGDLVKTNVKYAIVNEKESSPQIRVDLQVSTDDATDSITIATADSLGNGSNGGSYEYVPQEGWKDGVRYRFKLALYVADKLHTLSKLKMTTATETA